MKHFDTGNPKPELVIAVAGPVGTDLDYVVEQVSEILRTYRYETIPIKVSSLIKEWCDPAIQAESDAAKYDARVDLMMNAGDFVRTRQGNGNALVPLILTVIREQRRSRLVEFGYEEDQNRLELYNHCFLINSLKHPDEVSALRGIYKEKLLVISAFSGVEKRADRLCSLIAKSEGSTNNEEFRERARHLIDKDSKRADTDIGQNLSSTFHLADFFVRLNADAPERLGRFFRIFFSHPYTTPYRDEFFMYEAKANSLRSSDLSRQIGAVITNDNHDIVARGCNEVPLVSGGAYWPDMDPSLDKRDFTQSRDFNNVKKDQVLRELLLFLVEHRVFLDRLDGVDAETIASELVFGKFSSQFKNLRITNLIEFGRVIHAEMAALMEAARRGLAVQNGIIYTTTFPCHMCGRHIISAGIKRVVYIEPYPKSMIVELFPELVTIDSEEVPDRDHRGSGFSKVSFEPFEGVAPRLYPPLFTAVKRKDSEGYTVDWDKTKAQPKLARLSTSHLELELTIAKGVESLPVVTHKDLAVAKGIRDADTPRTNSGAKPER